MQATLHRAIDQLRIRKAKVAWVPTMRALHESHLTLIRTAGRRDLTVVASIIVNPTQFSPHADVAAYPRMLNSDLARRQIFLCAGR